jgi:hypothetical protein
MVWKADFAKQYRSRFTVSFVREMHILFDIVDVVSAIGMHAPVEMLYWLL